MKKLIILALFLVIMTYTASSETNNDPEDYTLYFTTDQITSQATLEIKEVSPNTHLLIQFFEIPSDQEKQDLATQGITLLSYLPNNAYFAAVKNKISVKDLNTKNIRYLSLVKDTWKISPYIQQNKFPSFAITKDNQVVLLVKYFDDVALDTIREKDMHILNKIKTINALVIKTTKENIPFIAKQDTVQWIQPYPGPEQDELDESRNTIHADEAVTQFNVSGLGSKVLLYESGFPYAHPDLVGRFFRADPNCYSSDHATHTAGIIMGNGSINYKYHGLAPAALIYDYCYDSSAINYNDVTGIEQDYQDGITTYDIDVASNSWGTPVSDPNCQWMGDYEAKAALFDSFVTGSLGKKFPIGFSAGNERDAGDCGYDPKHPNNNYYTLNPPKPAKNIITVGATNSNDDSMTSFSSWGPTDDGRIKPELVAPGAQSVPDYGITAPSGTTKYTPDSGTSFAVPHVTGTIALLQEEIRKKTNRTPLPSTFKALLVNTADDLESKGPDFKTGYGRVNVLQAFSSLKKEQIVEDVSVHRKIDGFKVTITNQTNIKVTLAWDDVPGTLNAAKELVNNIDLVALSPSGTRYYPYILDPLNPSLPATTGKDHLNNLEQVAVDTPEPGEWHIYVIGRKIPKPPQTYSIVANLPLEKI